METAVLYCVFNRLDIVKRTFEPIRQAKPKRFYIACDGARLEKDGEAEIVQEVRKYILDNIDWDCEVKTLFRETNLGCNGAIRGALKWLFDNEEKGIIIEDDILTSPQFFEFCEKMLIKYKDNEKVRAVSGYGFAPGAEEYYRAHGFKDEFYDYYFTHYTISWGWAAWRRSYKDMFPTKEEEKNCNNLEFFKSIFKDEIIARHHYIGPQLTKMNKSWDTDMHFKCYLLAKEGYCSINSRPTLVSNIGEVGTHYTEANSYLNRAIDELDVNSLKEPPEVKIDFDFLRWASSIGFKESYAKIYGEKKTNLFKLEKDLWNLRLKYIIRYLKMVTAPKKKRDRRELKYFFAEQEYWMLNRYKKLVHSK